MLLHEGGVLCIFLSEAEGELGDECASDGETDEEGPSTAELSPEEDGPWIELPHLCYRRSLSLSLSLRVCL